MNITKSLNKWNKVDQLIYWFETTMHNLMRNIYATSHEKDIDVETMIAAETDYLKAENEKLRKLQQPGILICEDGKYCCPHCKKDIEKDLVERYKTKFCPECGKRIILSVPYKYSYAISHIDEH